MRYNQERLRSELGKIMVNQERLRSIRKDYGQLGKITVNQERLRSLGKITVNQERLRSIRKDYGQLGKITVKDYDQNNQALVIFFFSRKVIQGSPFSRPFRQSAISVVHLWQSMDWGSVKCTNPVSSCRFVVQHQRQTTYVSLGMVVVGLCYPSPSTFPESCLPLT